MWSASSGPAAAWHWQGRRKVKKSGGTEGPSCNSRPFTIESVIETWGQEITLGGLLKIFASDF